MSVMTVFQGVWAQPTYKTIHVRCIQADYLCRNDVPDAHLLYAGYIRRM